MPFDQNNLPEWNAPGVEPPQSKKDSGWGPSEKPPADWFNWFFNKTYNALQSLFTNAQHKEEKGQPNGYAALNAEGKVVNADGSLAGGVQSVNNKTGAVTLTASDVGASPTGHTHTFAEITSKPTTLSGYGITDAIPTSQKGAANGVASLDGGAKVPTTQLPAASTTQAGIVQLNDTLTSTSTTQAATANAVKQAYDQATSAETNAKAYADTKIATVVPYTGATQDLNMNSKAIRNALAFGINDGNGDGYYFQFNEDLPSGDFALKSRNVSDGSVYKTVFTVTPNGIFTVFNQSMVHVTNSGTQNISSDVDTKVTLTNVVIDKQGEFANNRFTAIQSGIYFVRFYANFSSSTPTGDIFLKVFKNGTYWGTVAYENAKKYVSGATVIDLSAGGYLEFYILQSSGGTAKTLSGALMQVAKIQ